MIAYKRVGMWSRARRRSPADDNRSRAIVMRGVEGIGPATASVVSPIINTLRDAPIVDLDDAIVCREVHGLGWSWAYDLDCED